MSINSMLNFNISNRETMDTQRNRVCPVELADSLDRRARRWLQNPAKVLAPYLTPGMIALDLGCGPGFFTVELARLVGDTGRVIAADLQDGMLQKLAGKIEKTDLATRVRLVKCDTDNINVSDHVDFILAFYMVHEVPDKAALFCQIAAILKGDGQVLLVEPKLFHVSRTQFKTTVGIAESNGFRTSPGPRLRLSWSAILKKAPAGRSA